MHFQLSQEVFLHSPLFVILDDVVPWTTKIDIMMHIRQKLLDLFHCISLWKNSHIPTIWMTIIIMRMETRFNGICISTMKFSSALWSAYLTLWQKKLNCVKVEQSIKRAPYSVRINTYKIHHNHNIYEYKNEIRLRTIISCTQFFFSLQRIQRNRFSNQTTHMWNIPILMFIHLPAWH